MASMPTTGGQLPRRRLHVHRPSVTTTASRVQNRRKRCCSTTSQMTCQPSFASRLSFSSISDTGNAEAPRKIVAHPLSLMRTTLYSVYFMQILYHISPKSVSRQTDFGARAHLNNSPRSPLVRTHGLRCARDSGALCSKTYSLFPTTYYLLNARGSDVGHGTNRTCVLCPRTHETTKTNRFGNSFAIHAPAIDRTTRTDNQCVRSPKAEHAVPCVLGLRRS